jgi:hypothetical protein
MAFMNPGGIRGDMRTTDVSSGGEALGEVTYGEAFTVQPFGNSLVTKTMTGDMLRRLLEQQFPGCGAQTTKRILQVSAFGYEQDPAGATCESGSGGCLSTGRGRPGRLVPDHDEPSWPREATGSRSSTARAPWEGPGHRCAGRGVPCRRAAASPSRRSPIVPIPTAPDQHRRPPESRRDRDSGGSGVLTPWSVRRRPPDQLHVWHVPMKSRRWCSGRNIVSLRRRPWSLRERAPARRQGEVADRPARRADLVVVVVIGQLLRSS